MTKQDIKAQGLLLNIILHAITCFFYLKIFISCIEACLNIFYTCSIYVSTVQKIKKKKNLNTYISWSSTSGSYLYIDASFGIPPGVTIGQVAVLSIPIPLSSIGPYELSFWYHMLGRHTGTLTVEGVRYPTRTRYLIFRHSGEGKRFIQDLQQTVEVFSLVTECS